MNKTILICIAHAGGSSTLFNKWKNYLDPSIQLLPLELSGRGRRFIEPLYENIHDNVEDLFMQIKDYTNGNKYALFGHSMGGLIAYELYQSLMTAGYQEPEHIFISAKSHPMIQENEKILHKMPEDEFLNEIIKYGGTPMSFFDDEILRKAFTPVLRADYKSLETYQFNEVNRPVECDVTILYGRDDVMHQKEIDKWKNFVNGSCDFIGFDGGHFFINEHTQQVINLVNNILA